MWEYRAFVRKVYDGDTITVDFDLGFDILLKNQKIRLADINTPEVRGQQRAEGLISRDALRSRIANKWVIIKTTKDKKGKYGRWLGEVFLGDRNINDLLVEKGLAEVYK